MTTVAQHAQLVPTSPTTFNWFGTWTATAANGDELSGTAVGTITFTDRFTASRSSTTRRPAARVGFSDAIATFLGTAYGTRVAVVGTTSTGTFDATIDGELSF